MAPIPKDPATVQPTEQSDSAAINAQSPDEPSWRAEGFTEILAIARTRPSITKFFGETLRCLARLFNSPYAAIHLRYAAQVVQDDCHFGPSDPNFWKNHVQQFLTESMTEPRSRARLLKSRTGSAKVAFLSAPIHDPTGPTIGALALVVTAVQEEELTNRLASLEALCRLASFAAEFLGDACAEDGGSTAELQAHRAFSSAGALAQAASYATPAELAFALTNELCNKLGCQQVALSTVKGRHIELLSISGMDAVQKHSPGVAALTAAMEECLDAGTTIIVQRSGSWAGDRPDIVYRLHKQWHNTAGGDSVASIPLAVDGNPVLIVSFRRPPDHSFQPDELAELGTRIAPFGPALRLAQKAGRSVPRHIRERAGDIASTLIAPGRLGAKIGAMAALVASLAFFFGSADFNVTVPCVVAPAHVRHVTTPFDAVLAESLVIEGARVRRGDLLCSLDHRDLDQQRAELRAEFAVLERSIDRARADDKPVDVQLALANQQLAQARLEIVGRRIERCAVRAPIDGIVVSGDLRKRVGSVFARGEEMFAVAPLDQWTVELEVPDSRSADVAAGLTGYFASFACPDKASPFKVARVLADARNRESKNIYVAEAELNVHGDWLRPGMEGMAKIHVGRRRICWIALHRIVDYFRLKLWL